MSKHLSLYQKRARRVRNTLRKRAYGKVRLSVFRSGKHIYAQLIDDAKSLTVASASSLEENLGVKKTSGLEAAKKVGELIGKRAKEANIETVVFDRGGYLFHGRVKAVADAAREAGLKF